MFDEDMDISYFRDMGDNSGAHESLLIIGKKAYKNKKWKEYAIFCFKREEGFRKEALFHLDIFIKYLKKSSFKDQINFVTFLFKQFEEVYWAKTYSFPYPLRKIVKTILVEWCKVEKEDSSPFRWYGKFFNNSKCLLKALDINSSDDKSRAILIDMWLYSLEYSCHHLPEAYLGNLNNDFALIEKIDKFIYGFSDEVSKKSFKKELDEFKEIISNYQLWQKSKEPNFKDWGSKNKKRVSFNIPAYYYEK